MTIQTKAPKILKRRKSDIHDLASAEDGSGHHIAIVSQKTDKQNKKTNSQTVEVLSWGKSNDLGQLGRPGNPKIPLPIHMQSPSSKDSNCSSQPIRVYAGGFRDAGHSAILTQSTSKSENTSSSSSTLLWVTGCDRWQQLGLGSSKAGASGYTWKALWQESFVPNYHLQQFMKEEGGGEIRDVALGGDHTIVLSSNQVDVISFGKGSEGQLGLIAKPFVHSIAKSKELSIPSSSSKEKIGAVCAIEHCSLTLREEDGSVMTMVGKCRKTAQSFQNALNACQARAEMSGLLKKKDNNDDGTT